ncbi:hypothetical protein [Wenzhouxiangella marina]|uniref:Uncharacterized protein n=1 Tax=Wenzhouxiangella marina TaxID=1579979 RepID=A0A0K0Y0B7_9GAMM|nr:hypothetical protein [Wenzhouxiangella marina]AKS43388.1 hypothetical protein WM2015_3036 [Wenzhouxiangella marina]MBB6088496.1 hypothetical protein [Wenzhouxiangella marina]
MTEFERGAMGGLMKICLLVFLILAGLATYRLVDLWASGADPGWPFVLQALQCLVAVAALIGAALAGPRMQRRTAGLGLGSLLVLTLVGLPARMGQVDVGAVPVSGLLLDPGLILLVLGLLLLAVLLGKR